MAGVMLSYLYLVYVRENNGAYTVWLDFPYAHGQVTHVRMLQA